MTNELKGMILYTLLVFIFIFIMAIVKPFLAQKSMNNRKEQNSNLENCLEKNGTYTLKVSKKNKIDIEYCLLDDVIIYKD